MSRSARSPSAAGSHAGRMLGTLALAWAVLQTGRFVLPLLLPEVRGALDLSLAQTGLVLTSLQAAYALSQYPSGRLSDSWSRATLLVPGLFVLSLGFLLVGRATAYLPLLAGAAALGLGKGLYSIPSRARLSDLFGARQGRALGLFSAGSDAGGVVASAAAVLVIQHATWRAPFYPIALVLVVVLVLYAVWSREPYTASRTSLEIVATVRRLVATPQQRRTLLAYSAFFFVVNGVITFFPAYLRTTKAFTPTTASAAYALVFVVGLGAKPASGALSDRVPRRLVSIAALLVAAASLGALVVSSSLVAVGVATAAFAVGYKAQFPVIDALVMAGAPSENVGGDLGAARGLFLAVGSLGPAAIGLVAQLAGYGVAFAGLATCLVVAAALLAVDS